MRGVFAAVLLSLALVAGATAANGRAGGGGHAPLLGIVPHAGGPAPRVLASTKATNLQYWGGRVMRQNTTYAIYWVPSGFHVDANYESTLNRYFSDVAAASGTNGNVYSTDTQYYDTTGPIAYDSTFGGSYVDTTAFPASGCNEFITPVCLTDWQLKSEIQRVITRKGWPDGENSLFFVMTPDTVGVCFSGASNTCASNSFCAYHSYFNGTDGNPIVYAVQPYVATIGGCNTTPGGAPNGQPEDTALSTVSHEHNESITDPLGDAWLTATGDEDGDLCAWTFGSPIGRTTEGQTYNQLINGHPYSIQEEWSNDGARCLQRYGTASAPANTSPPVVSGVAAVGRTLSTTNGGWTGTPTSYGYQWQRCTAGEVGCHDIPGATAMTYRLASADANYVVRSEVRASNGIDASALVASVATELVVPRLTTTTPPAISGVAAVGKTLSTTDGTWNAAASIAYRWLRCSASGTGCTTIGQASSSTYVVRKVDAGHTLEARITATNAAGSAVAYTDTTSVVQNRPSVRETPRISGRFRVGRRLSATTGAWLGGPSAYTYQWLRCSATGHSCTRIPGATHPTYVVRKGDAGHRIRVRVVARNAVGAAHAQSPPTAVVPKPATRHRKKHVLRRG